MRTARASLLMVATLVVVLAGLAPLYSQLPPVSLDQGPIGLALALRRLPMTGSVLHITAHPDDEDNALLVKLNRGEGIRTGLLTLTRGDGGQNEIGPELFESLGIIRTGELMSMHRYDGAEQFFTRAFEFGYSFSVEETLEKWGKQETLGDIVALIRRFRPQVILTLPREGQGGGQHHQTSAILAAEAFRAAADPNRFPEQLETGLRPWQASKIYERYRRSGGGSHTGQVVQIETGVFDAVLGKTYAEIGTLARSYHKCQGMAQLTALPGPRRSTWKLVDSVIGNTPAPGNGDLFAGIDTTLSAIIPSGAESGPIAAGVSQLESAIQAALGAYSPTHPEKTAPALAQGLRIVRELRLTVAQSPFLEQTRFETDFLLSQKEKEFQHSLALAHQIRLQALAVDGLVIPGQTVQVTLNAAYGGQAGLRLASLELVTPRGWAVKAADRAPSLLAPGDVFSATFDVQVAPEAAITEPYWYRASNDRNRFELRDPQAFGRPWGPPPATARLTYVSNGVEAVVEQPVQYRYTGPWVGGEQRHSLMVVPAVSVAIDPGIQILPRAAASGGFTARVTSTFNGIRPAQGSVALSLPAGWSSTPLRHSVQFGRSGENLTVSFEVRPPADVEKGRHRLTAVATVNGREYREGHRFIDYDHIQKRVIYEPAATQVEVLDVVVSPGVRLGYIDGVGDYVPAALKQLGLAVEFLDETALSQDLSRFNVIVTGIRAYLVREDLKAHNDHLLEWVEAGGTLIVQYNKFEFNGPAGTARRGGAASPSPYAPRPVRVGRGRVTDESAPIRALETDHPVLTSPNRIGPDDWAGWVQERGLYFLADDRDPAYRDLVVTADPFKYNSGDKYGSLVELRHGRGRWIYVGLGLWRQLPAGVPGSYRLLANLVSLGGE